MNTNYCIYPALAKFLEKFIQDGKGVNTQWLLAKGVTDDWFPEVQQDKEVAAAQLGYFNMLKSQILSPDFVQNGEGKLGTHSVKKFGTTYSRTQGAPPDAVDYQARWKCTCIQDQYTDIQLD